VDLSGGMRIVTGNGVKQDGKGVVKALSRTMLGVRPRQLSTRSFIHVDPFCSLQTRPVFSPVSGAVSLFEIALLDGTGRG
jgi:hypothetical protein